MVRRATILTVYTLAISIIPCSAQSFLEQMEREVAGVVRKARAGVVAIEDERLIKSAAEPVASIPNAKEAAQLKGLKRIPSEEKPTAPPTAPKSGSGFCIAEDYIVTTADVLEGMQNPLVVTDSGARYRARIVKIDPELNIGLLRLPEKNGVPELPTHKTAAIDPGSFAITIGNLGGQINTVSLATVSGMRPEGTFSGSRFYPRLIQISGIVGAGSSGSPVLNARGELMGMLSAASAPAQTESGRTAVAGTSFAIPIEDVQPVVEEMRHAKFYARAWIGVDLREEGKVQESASTVNVRRSLYVEGVYPDSPAARAGLRKGDLVQRMNGREIRTLGDFRAAIVALKLGSTLTIEVQRDGRTIKTPIDFQMRPPSGKP